jgi:hypothetical protein
MQLALEVVALEWPFEKHGQGILEVNYYTIAFTKNYHYHDKMINILVHRILSLQFLNFFEFYHSS